MNADLMLKYFERISEAPDAVARLQRFIFDLAVRGKLVEQDPNDEPAAELLKRILAGKTKKATFLSPVAPNELPFDLPQGWGVARFGDLYSLEYGDNLPSEKRSNTGEFPVYGSNGEVGSHFECFVNSPCIVVGRKGSAGALNLSLTNGCCVTDVAYYCIPPNGLDMPFSFKLFHTLRLDSLGKGVKPGLSRNEAYVLPIAIPPLAEQLRIVAKVDELMALCDQLQAAQNEREARRDRLVAASLHRIGTAPATADKAENGSEMTTQLPEAANFHLAHLPHLTTRPEHIKQLRQAILNLAVRGRLVSQDPNDEPAGKLLKRIHAENERLIRAGKIREQKPLSTEREDISVKLPSTWQSVRLAEIVYLRSGIAIEYGDDQLDGEIPYVKVSDLSIAGNNKGIFTSSRFIDEKYADSIIERGSIVFPKRGGAIATNRKRVTHVEVVCDSNLMAMRPFLHETSAFLQLWFSGFDLWQLNSGTSVPQINNKDIYPLFMPLPPLAEQHRIVAKVDELMVLCDQLEAQLTTTQTDSRHLLEAVLHDALAPAMEEVAI